MAVARHLEEWSNVLGLLHQLAGAVGLLAIAEEGATPRVLADLTGPLSRADDLVKLQRRLPHDRLALPPGPGEASMTLVRNKIH